MNKKFLSAILFGALMVTSTGTFVSCKDYDDDIDQINSELSEVKTQISALQNAINAGKWISSISQTANGLTIVLSDGTSYTVENGKDGAAGADGAAGTEWTISEDGFWVCNGEKTDVKAVGQDGAAGQDAQPEVKKENGKWYLWNGTEFEEITVEAPAAANVPYYFTDPNDANYTILVVWDANGENKQEIRLPMNEGLAQIQVLGNCNFDIKYGIAKEGTNWKRWDGPKAKPAKGELMIGKCPTTIRVQVTPANYDLAAADLKLVNSLGEELPVELGEAVAVKEVLTVSARGVSPVGIFDIPVIETEITEETTEAYAESVNYFIKGSEKVYSTYNKDNAFSLEFSQAKDQTVTFGIEEDLVTPGAACTVVPTVNKAYLYDSYITMANTTAAKADSIRYGITFDGMTIKCNEKAEGTVNFTVHYINVAGGVLSQNLSVKYGVEEEAYVAPMFTEIPSIAHTVTEYADAKGNKLQYLYVDLKPYFDTMTAAERLVWNDEFRGFGQGAVEYVNADGETSRSNIVWIYEDAETGKDVINMPWLMGYNEGDVVPVYSEANTTDPAKIVGVKYYFQKNYNGGSWNAIVKKGGSLKAGVAVYANDGNGTKNIMNIEVPFTIAAPAAETIAAAYTLNASYKKDGVITVYGDEIAYNQIISAGDVLYTFKNKDQKIKLDGDTYADMNGKVKWYSGTVTLADDGKKNTAYTLAAMAEYAGAYVDIADINVKFATNNDYVVTAASAVSLLSGSGQTATVYYGKAADAKDTKNYYRVSDVLGNMITTGVTVTAEVPATYAGHLTATVDASKNIVLTATKGDEWIFAVNTQVTVKVTIKVGDETHPMNLAVTLKAPAN